MRPSNATEQCSQAMQPSIATDGRTDGRTNADPRSPSGDTSPLVTRGRAYGDFPVAPFTTALEEAIDALGVAHERMPVIRTGERVRIAEDVRLAILMRDEFRCGWCGGGAELYHIDHITPWSNGGSDRTDNLRTLCSDCNERRSNRTTDIWARPLPIATCDRCWWLSAGGPPDGYDNRIAVWCPRHKSEGFVSSEVGIW